MITHFGLHAAIVKQVFRTSVFSECAMLREGAAGTSVLVALGPRSEVVAMMHGNSSGCKFIFDMVREDPPVSKWCGLQIDTTQRLVQGFVA